MRDEPALIVRLRGGLGNQLFQYAAMRALSLRLGVELKLDIHSGFARDPHHRKYMLGAFSIPVGIADDDEVERYRRAHLPSRLVRRWLETTAIRWRGTCYFPWLLAGLAGGSYAEGYWQSECYFTSAADNLKKELRPRQELHCACGIADSESAQRAVVAVHARRLNFPQACPTAYYQNAYNHISSRHPNAVWYAFGDDTDWIEKVLARIVPCTLIRRSGLDADIEEFCAMSSAQHFVIANSTFSWWAAWLGSSHNSTVVAPRRGWCQSGKAVRDLLPPHWVTL